MNQGQHNTAGTADGRRHALYRIQCHKRVVPSRDIVSVKRAELASDSVALACHCQCVEAESDSYGVGVCN